MGEDITSIRADRVEPREVTWLWFGRLALGKLTVLDGDPGLGKSTLCAQVAAAITSGVPLPGGPAVGPRAVLILSAEDDLQDTVRPRLGACGADLRLAHLVGPVWGGGSISPITLPDDIPALERVIRAIDAALVIVDPFVAYLSEKVDSAKDQHARRVMAQLAALAERTRSSILLLRHLRKATAPNALYRGGGSIGIIAAARVGLILARSPVDPALLVLAGTKSNVGPLPNSLVLSIDHSQKPPVSWNGESPISAGFLLDRDSPEHSSALEECAQFLRDVLGNGPVATDELMSRAKSLGLSERTLRRVKGSLGSVSRRLPSDLAGGSSRWYWALNAEAFDKFYARARESEAAMDPAIQALRALQFADDNHWQGANHGR
jgi:putative DNA primase/helicase